MWKDYLPALPWIFSATALTYAVYVTFHFTRGKGEKSKVNFKVEKNNSKVVHTMDIEDIGTKAVYCRCWRSSKFPYCDGSHTAHNELTGDNVGPLIVKKKEL